ncbi:helix-turn-helix domain-containing protein [Nocardiopsis sp. EMB25]|uniref:helix-turn-helix domain-containing protein n=1 Tax=Nocardiopsis sp. EMB25 TaxID=2835867 RepID=UPI002285011B|nr:helix-turn-helix domain-containing protein [Nocardiopsis sp. EMB25]MCY9786384.1 helix-turn-helix domain-containing protein [Nocardiopsis sp. EMB25]
MGEDVVWVRPRSLTASTAGEVADLFRVADATVHRWARQGRVRCVRTPSGGQRFDEAEIHRVLGSQAVEGSGRP